MGCFQLYKQSLKYKYISCNDCGGCDNNFRDLFKEKICLNISICHLGVGEMNWYGRDKNNIYEKF